MACARRHLCARTEESERPAARVAAVHLPDRRVLRARGRHLGGLALARRPTGQTSRGTSSPCRRWRSSGGLRSCCGASQIAAMHADCASRRALRSRVCVALTSVVSASDRRRCSASATCRRCRDGSTDRRRSTSATASPSTIACCRMIGDRIGLSLERSNVMDVDESDCDESRRRPDDASRRRARRRATALGRVGRGEIATACLQRTSFIAIAARATGSIREYVPTCALRRRSVVEAIAAARRTRTASRHISLGRSCASCRSLCRSIEQQDDIVAS